MRRFTTVVTLALWLLVAVVLTSAECPNGCSGNGACMQKDMCNCYKNYQGNDCADRTCPFSYAHVDTPKGDINMDMDRATAGWLLTDSQQDPAGTYEFFNPNAKDNEAHFYMECSNKGICDRATGLCTCFDGYEGSSCHRTTCPSKCTGHGTCESMRELGAKAGGTLFGIEYPGGATSYDLWDANSTYGCRCDPWFRGPDCSKRTCKVGVDPLFLAAGTARYETFVIHAGATAAYPNTAWIRLRVFDHYGESYITSKITVLDDSVSGNDALNAAAVKKALKAVPNLTFRDITCEPLGLSGGDLKTFVSTRPAVAMLKGMSVICQYTDNPGKHRIPEIASFFIDLASSKAMVVTTGVQGENDEWFTKQSTLLLKTTAYATPIDASTKLILSLAVDLTQLPPAPLPTLIKIGADIVLTSTWTTITMTLAFPLAKTIGSNTPIFLPSFATGSAITVTALAGINIPSVAVNVGDDFFTFTAKPTTFTTGDLLFFHNQFFYVQQISGGPAPFLARLDKPFGGNSLNGGPSTPPNSGASPAVVGDIPYKVVLPADKSFIYNYVSECSGRGLCGSDTGICTCFKGYTNDNCNTQNILAL